MMWDVALYCPGSDLSTCAQRCTQRPPATFALLRVRVHTPRTSPFEDPRAEMCVRSAFPQLRHTTRCVSEGLEHPFLGLCAERRDAMCAKVFNAAGQRV